MTDWVARGHSPVVALRLPAALADDPPVLEPLDFDDVYDAHVAFVWRIVRRLGVPEAGLDDAVQDVFVVVHRRLDDFEGRSSVRTWIYGIARRVARDHRRRVERRGGDAVSVEVGCTPSDEPSPAVRAANAEALRAVAGLLSTLPDEQREVFVLAELEEMSAPEIAAATGAKINTVYSRLRLARAAFNRGVEGLRELADGGDDD